MFIIAAITGFKKGAIKEFVSLIGTIIIFIVSYSLKGIVGNFLCLVLPFFIEDLVTINIIFYQIIGFLLVYGVLSFIFNYILGISNLLDKLINKVVILKIPFKILGSIVSIVNMYLLIFILLILLSIPFRNSSIIKNSLLSDKIIYKTPVLSEYSETVVNLLESIILLDNEIAKSKITINEGNLKILDLLLKYNMIDKETVLDLYNKGKIREIKDIETVVLNY